MKTDKKEREASKKCKYCSKIFTKRSNCVKHMCLHEEDDASSAVRETNLENESQNASDIKQLPSFVKHGTVYFVCQSEIFPIIQPPSTPPPTAISSETREVFKSSQPTTSVFLTSPAKVSCLEGAINFIKKLSNNEYPFQANHCIIQKLKRDLINNKKNVISYIQDSLDSHLDDDGFFKWLAKSLLYKPNRLRSLLDENKANCRNGRILENTYQEIYYFQLANNIN